MFALTGFTLNHAADIEAKAAVTTKEATLPAEPSLLELAAARRRRRSPVPQSLSAWVSKEFGIAIDAKDAEWSATVKSTSRCRGRAEMPGSTVIAKPGRRATNWTSRGWIAYLNDLHKGRNTGPAWSWFIDIFAAACVVFSRHRPLASAALCQKPSVDLARRRLRPRASASARNFSDPLGEDHQCAY